MKTLGSILIFISTIGIVNTAIANDAGPVTIKLTAEETCQVVGNGKDQQQRCGKLLRYHIVAKSDVKINHITYNNGGCSRTNISTKFNRTTKLAKGQSTDVYAVPSNFCLPATISLDTSLGNAQASWDIQGREDKCNICDTFGFQLR